MKNEEETLDRCILSVRAVQRSRGGSEGHAAMRCISHIAIGKLARMRKNRGAQLVRVLVSGILGVVNSTKNSTPCRQ